MEEWKEGSPEKKKLELTDVTMATASTRQELLPRQEALFPCFVSDLQALLPNSEVAGMTIMVPMKIPNPYIYAIYDLIEFQSSES